MRAGEVKLPCALQLKKRKKMEKKFYEMPEVEVIKLQLEGALLDGSDPGIIEGDGDTGDLG